MVSGFFTSPNDHERIRSGDARPMRIESKSSDCRCWLKRFSRSFMFVGSPQSCGLLLAFELDVDRDRPDFLLQDVEGFRYAGGHLVVAVHDVLVHLVAAADFVGLDR